MDPRHYRLVIHGMVERPLVLTLEDLKRFPSVTRTYFIECAGNGQNGYRNPPDPELTATRSRGLASNASWTGVPLALLLKEAGVKPGARWLIPEGMDAAMYTRSLPWRRPWRTSSWPTRKTGRRFGRSRAIPCVWWCRGGRGASR